MATLPSLSVERFRNMPDDGRRYELHYGEMVEVGYPKQKYYDMQERLIEVLVARLPRSWQVSMEFPYRVWAEFELRFADVAVVSETRRAATDPEDNLHGAPELVIEVKSPSSTPEELRELAALCLAEGSLEFWVVDLESVSVTVVHRNGKISVFGAGQVIPLAAFGGESLPVDEIFG